MLSCGWCLQSIQRRVAGPGLAEDGAGIMFVPFYYSSSGGTLVYITDGCYT
jgi:hypothetical protein